MPTFYSEGFHKELFNDLKDVEEGRLKRLMVCMPPRTCKSEAISKRFPAYCLGRNPERSIVCCSYNSDVASYFGRKALNIVKSTEHKNVFESFELADDKKESGNWETSKGGGYYSVGVGGALTSRGFDCLPAETRISTTYGDKRIDELCFQSSPCKILAYDENSQKVVEKRIKSVGVREETRLYRITTKRGRVVEATGNHPFFTGEGYTKARELAYGDSLLCRVWDGDNKKGIRNEQVGSNGTGLSFLFKQVLGCFRKQKGAWRKTMQKLQEANASQSRKILLGAMQDLLEKKQVCRCSDGKSKREGLQAMWENVLQTKKLQVLLKKVCRSGSQSFNDWNVESYVEERINGEEGVAVQLEGVQRDKATCYKERFAFVRSMQVQKQDRSTSHRPKSSKQHRDELSVPMQKVSHKTTQCRESTEKDTVVLVEEIRGKFQVFNLSVEDCENYFANGVLTHNCGIIDDPFKNREEAESLVIREKVWDWYTSTFYTRRQGEDAAIILVNTRWNVDDLAGRILEQEGHLWKVLSFPALDEHDNPLVTRPGFGKKFYVDTRDAIGVRDFAALYQQDPIASTGNVFSKDQFRYFALSDLNPKDFTFAISVDPAFSSRDESDDVAIMTTAKHKLTGEIYVLDVFAAPILPAQAYEYIISACERWKGEWTMDYLSVEDVSISKDQQLFINGLDQKMRAENKFYTVLPFKPQGLGKKEDRIKYSLDPMFTRHAIYFRSDDKGNKDWQKLEEQLLKFPASRRDDLSDALSQAVIMWQNRGRTPDTHKASRAWATVPVP